MAIELASEYNKNGVLMQFPNYPGAYTRGETEEVALGKAKQELQDYTKWAGLPMPQGDMQIVNREKARDGLHIHDADTEILLHGDCRRLSDKDFDKISSLAIFSANCVLKLYNCITDKNWVQPEKQRPSFLGKPPSTAQEMLLHIDAVSRYYTSRIGINADFIAGWPVENRVKCMDLLRNHYFAKPFQIFEVDGERWTETKVLRRFIWHDRIHAKALYRHGLKMGMKARRLENPFFFTVSGR